MEKQTLGHQQKYVTKDERVENLWKKLIGQETDLSEETIAWMARRILQLRHRAYSEPCSVLGYRATGMENVPDRELPGMETSGKLKIES